jgi:hypothetical protein
MCSSADLRFRSSPYLNAMSLVPAQENCVEWRHRHMSKADHLFAKEGGGFSDRESPRTETIDEQIRKLHQYGMAKSLLSVP